MRITSRLVLILAALGGIALPLHAQDVTGTWLCLSRGDSSLADPWAGAGIKTYNADGTGSFALRFEAAFDGVPMSLDMDLSFTWSLEQGDRLVETASDGKVRSLFVNGEWAKDTALAQDLVNDLIADSQLGTVRHVSESFMVVDWRDDWDSCIRQ